MNIRNINKNYFYNTNKTHVKKSYEDSSFIQKRQKVTRLFAFKKDTLFSTCIDDEKGREYSFVGSYAEDYTRENPKIKIEYISFDKNEHIVKYIDPRQVDFRNATVDEYYAAVYYLNNGQSHISGSEEPGTTGLDYNNKDRYDFVALLERDIEMYQANGIHHHVARYQKILNGIESLMSTDYYKNNVETGKRGIGVKEALTISRKKHGIPYGNIKINKAIDMVDKYLEENKNRQIKEKKEQIKRIRAKRKQDKEDFEELLEKLRINRQLTKEKIFETQAERKDI